MTNHDQIRYLPDADVLIAAYRDRYPPDLFPGFWDCLSHHLAERSWTAARGTPGKSLIIRLTNRRALTKILIKRGVVGARRPA